ncbi:MAG: D-alanyl-D-alanine carboxypeptidase [Lachnospiraceae bacterium]|nr:D-alanyl-D-alanine carboxypeptidase [Lachnospiraceae bacterium]
MKKHLQKITALLLSALIILCFSVPVYAADKAEVDRIIGSIPAEWPQPPQISASTAILMDADSGEIIYAKDATRAMYPASTTKLMTALLALENSSLSDIVDFPFAAVDIPSGSSHIGMRRGEQMELRECLYGLLLPSANEVANALAIHISEYISNFVVLMNERALRLGTVNTVFTNANGLHEDGHYTCAYDLALIMRACVQNTTFVEISSTPSYVHHADTLLPKDIPMTNTDLMIRRSSEYYNEDVVCGKTGHTENSGYNLVSYAERDNMRLIAVVMGCEDGAQYLSTQSLLDYGFNYFHQVLPGELDSSLAMNAAFTSSPLALPTPERALLFLDQGGTILLPDTITFDMLDKQVEDVEGGKLVTYLYRDFPLGSVRLSYGEADSTSSIFREKEKEQLSTESVEPIAALDGWLIVSLFALLLLLIFFIILTAKIVTPRKKYR